MGTRLDVCFGNLPKPNFNLSLKDQRLLFLVSTKLSQSIDQRLIPKCPETVDFNSVLSVCLLYNKTPRISSRLFFSFLNFMAHFYLYKCFRILLWVAIPTLSQRAPSAFRF